MDYGILVLDGQVLSVRTTASMPEEAFSRLLLDRMGGVMTPPLPTGCRFFLQPIRSTVGETVYVCEVKPGIKTLAVETYSHQEPQYYEVAMPWQYFVFKFQENPASHLSYCNEINLFWSPVRVLALTDRVFPARLPNIHGDSGVCMGHTIPSSQEPVDRRIEDMINGFYSKESIFQGDLGFRLPRKYEGRETRRPYYFDENGNFTSADRAVSSSYGSPSKGFEGWQKESKENPLCWMKWHWTGTHDYTLAQYVHHATATQQFDRLQVINEMIRRTGGY
jgi:hypothetical protein